MTAVTRKQRAEKHSLLNDIVLRNVFDHLDMHDLISCQQVCWKWKKIASPFLRRKAAIVLDDFTIRPDLKNPKMLEKTFQNSTTMIPFTAYTIRPNRLLNINRFVQFLRSKRNEMTALTLDNVAFSDGYGLSATVYRLSDHMGPNVRKLMVTTSRPPLKWTSAWSTVRFTTIDELTMVGVLIYIEPLIEKAAPKSVTLKDLKFKSDDTDVLEPVINQVIDFSKCKNICLEDNITLNMDMEINCDSVILNNVKVTNWGRATGFIANLTIYFGTFSLGTMLHPQMHIKRLVLNSTVVNLSAFPLSTEELILSICRWRQPTVVHLPNLRYLKLQISQDSILPLAYFRQCDQLSKVDLVCYKTKIRAPLPKLDFSSLPPNLDKLGIFGSFRIVGKSHQAVSNICITHSTPQIATVNKMILWLQPKNVIYQICGGGKASFLGRILMSRVSKFIVGMIEEKIIVVRKRKLSKMIFTKRAYIFENGKIKKKINRKSFIEHRASW